MLKMFRKAPPVTPTPVAEFYAEATAPVIKPLRQRLTVAESRERILSTSRLTLAARGECDWREAYQYDMKEAINFIEGLCSDMSKITGVQVTPTASFELESLADLRYGSIGERVSEMAAEFAARFCDYADHMIHRGLEGSRLPVTRVTWGENRETVAFKFSRSAGKSGMRSLDTEEIEVVYLQPALKDKDDFTRSIPDHAKATFDVLDQTHFDYKAKILDGFLAKMTRVVVSSVAFDPAIAVNLGTQAEPDLRIVDFWREPFKADEPSLMKSAPVRPRVTLGPPVGFDQSFAMMTRTLEDLQALVGNSESPQRPPLLKWNPYSGQGE
jgi:hypothetical protein